MFAVTASLTHSADMTKSELTFSKQNMKTPTFKLPDNMVLQKIKNNLEHVML